MKKLSLIITAVIITVMVVNLSVEHKSSNVSNLALANIHLLSANAEDGGGGTSCSTTCPDNTTISVSNCQYCSSKNMEYVKCWDKNDNLIEEKYCSTQA
ncbi:MAG: hypothetical protein WC384_06275 [Prolixibacteraceae bacterium]